ncbi:hypothetical protein TNCV_1943581 [Trichonephila clavipes]|nr:hypothetical protein TNCV_1943581 [Trichonephila clavipes]
MISRQIICIRLAENSFYAGQILVWEDIIVDGSTSLHILDADSVAAQLYKDEDLEHIVTMFRTAIGQHIILVDDNTGSHGANLDEDSICWMECSVKSL